MPNIVLNKPLLRRPSRGEVVFLGILAFVFGILIVASPFRPLDWFQQDLTATLNEKQYDGDGVIVEISETAIAELGDEGWSPAVLANLLTKIDAAGPKSILVEQQYFPNEGLDGEEELRAATVAASARIYWQIKLAPEDILALDSQGVPTGSGSPEALEGFAGVPQSAVPTAMVFRPSPYYAPVQAPYVISTRDGSLPSSANALSDGNPPASNVFKIDLSYDPETIPVVDASAVLASDMPIEELRAKKVVVAFTTDLQRDFIATPNSSYTSRAAATLMAAQTLNRGPTLELGLVPAFLFVVLVMLVWTFLRAPYGRWIALLLMLCLALSTLILERYLIFQGISQGVALFAAFAIFKAWRRGSTAIKTYRSADESKSRFLAQASHDLRQPIHAIGLLSERLAQTDLSPDQEELVAKISWSVGNASRMFRALLDVAAIESGTLRPEFVSVAVSELLAEVDIQNALAAEQADVDLRLVPSELRVRTDPALLGTMLQNLVSNAIKYSPGKKVLVGCRKQGSQVSFYVVDNGRGISSADLKHVKKEFYRSSTNSSLRADDKGLGLAIVNRLSLMLGLKFVLNSNEGRGTSAIIAGVPLLDSSANASQKPDVKPRPLAGLRVAVADDDLETLRSTETLLRNWGCEVSAFERLPTHKIDADVLLSDFDFGQGNTLESHTAALRRMVDAGTRVIVISGHHPDTIREAVPDLTRHILAKPLRAAVLRSALLSVRVS